MSKIKEILEGVPVEWKALGEVCKIQKGKQLNKTELSGDGLYPAYNGGVTHSGFTNEFNVKENTTIISQGGANAGYVQFISQKFWANAHCYYLEPNATILINKFVFYFIKNKQNELMECQYGAGIPALSSSKLSNLQIPIPYPNDPKKSIEIQEEIVRILDNFSTLTAELQAELQARKSQYKYYRDMLLTFKTVK